MSHISRGSASPPDYSLETAFLRPGERVVVAGVDEAGRGAWAGPVVAAAVILEIGGLRPSEAGEGPKGAPSGLRDSKLLSRQARERLFAAITGGSGRSGGGEGGGGEKNAFAVGVVERDEIDRRNILQASLQAMCLAVEGLTPVPDVLLVDGNRLPPLPPQLAERVRMRAVVGGDRRSVSIAAASIIAKVSRDRIMARLGRAAPHYGWEHNAGYGTAEHRAALRRFGVSEEHRLSFAPIREILRRQRRD